VQNTLLFRAIPGLDEFGKALIGTNIICFIFTYTIYEISVRCLLHACYRSGWHNFNLVSIPIICLWQIMNGHESDVCLSGDMLYNRYMHGTATCTNLLCCNSLLYFCFGFGPVL
jgi:hypothetical protein